MKLLITTLVLLYNLAAIRENSPSHISGSEQENRIRFFTWYLDADADGYWVASRISNISPGLGWTRTLPPGGLGDCNDADPTVHSLIRYYRDNDGDGFGSGNINISVLLCTSPAPSGFSGNNLDCDDTDPAKKAYVTWYQDSDGDSYGNPDVFTRLCPLTVPVDYVTNNLDCNDGNAAINPNTLWYKDADNDLYYTGVAIRQCLSPGTGYRRNGLIGGGDCNDGNAAINPNTLWFLDADDDKYFADTIRQCISPGPGFRRTGIILGGQDCNDANSNVNPVATEMCGDGLDNNCNGQVDESNITLNVSPGTGTYSVCKGSSLTLVAFSSTAISYQWMKGRQDLAGETSSTLVVTKAGEYKVRVADARNCTVISGIFTINIVICANGAIVESDLTSTVKALREKTVSNELDGVKVFANPTRHEFSLVLSPNYINEPVTMTVRNSNLQIIQSIKNIENLSISFGKDFKAGIYYVELRSGNKRTTIKLLKL